MINRFCAIIVLLLLLHTGQSQSIWSGIEIGGLAGNMLDIYPSMPPHSIHRGAFMSLRWGGKSAYRELYNNVESGIQASFHDLGNPSVLGYGIGLQYQATFNQYITRRIRSFQRFNVGGIYVTEPYDYLNNTANNVFSSDVSALLSVSAGLRYKFRQNAIALQASYWHSSNAHTVLPNVGMNVPMLMLSLEKFFYKEDIYVLEEKEPFKIDNRIGLLLYGVLGFNEAGGTVRPTNGNTYRKQLASIGATYRFRTIHRVSLSLEGYHDDAYALWNNAMEWTESKDYFASTALMLMMGHEFIFGHFGWIINGGVNLYNPTLDRIINEVEQRNFSSISKRYVPGRFAVRYYFNKSENNLGAAFVQLGVKSNLGQADFMEIGIGCLISKKQG
jgi:hypothetical protein